MKRVLLLSLKWGLSGINDMHKHIYAQTNFSPKFCNLFFLSRGHRVFYPGHHSLDALLRVNCFLFWLFLFHLFLSFSIFFALERDFIFVCLYFHIWFNQEFCAQLFEIKIWNIYFFVISSLSLSLYSCWYLLSPIS